LNISRERERTVKGHSSVFVLSFASPSAAAAEEIQNKKVSDAQGKKKKKRIDMKWISDTRRATKGETKKGDTRPRAKNKKKKKSRFIW